MFPWCNPTQCESLAPEEPPTLAIRASPPLAAFRRRTGRCPKRRHPLRMELGQFPESECDREFDRTQHIGRPAILDQFFERVAKRRRQLERRRHRFRPRTNERPDGFRSRRLLMGAPILVEEFHFLFGEANSEKVGGGS
jgi:hypothetical protein